MFRHYHHGHSAGLGFLLAIALYQHALVYGLLMFAAGLVAGRAWGFWSHAAAALREKVLHSRQERIDTRPKPVYSTRRRR